MPAACSEGVIDEVPVLRERSWWSGRSWRPRYRKGPERRVRATDSAEQKRLRDETQPVLYEDTPVALLGRIFSIVPYADQVENLTVRIYPPSTDAYPTAE